MEDAQQIFGGLESLVRNQETVPEQPFVPAQVSDPVQEKMQEYAKAKLDLINQQKALIDSLQARVSQQPSEKLFAISQALLTPTKTGRITEGIANALGAIQTGQKEEDARRMQLAKMRLELGQQQLGLSKEDIDLARQQQEARAVNQILSGSASGQPSGVVAETQVQSIYSKMSPDQKALVRTMKPDDARKYILEIAKKEIEPSDEERKYKFWVSQFPPEQQPLVQNIFRNKAVLGDTQGIAKSIIDINTAYKQGVIDPNTRNQLLSMVSTIGGQGVVRETYPTDEQAKQRALGLAETGAAFSIQGPEQQPTQPAAQPKPAEQKFPVPSENLTPAAKQAVAAKVAEKRSEMDIEEEKALKNSANEAEDAVRDANQFIRIAKETPTAFGRFSSPSVANAVTNILSGGVTLPFGMGIKVPELKQALINYGANEKEVNAMQMIDFMSIKQQLTLGQMMKGSVSNFERELVSKATISKEDTANTALFKASMIRARAVYNKQLWELYRKEGRSSGMSVDDFKDENPKAVELKKNYDAHLRAIDDRFGAR